jgi:hypothetical protein
MKDVEENLLGYLLGALDDEERRQVEDALEADPAMGRRLDLLRRALVPLEADRDDPVPPPRLTGRTLALVASHRPDLLPMAPRETSGPQGRGRGWWRHSDALVASVLVLVLLGMGAAWVSRAWQEARVTECKNNLREFHRALAQYSAQQPDGALPAVKADGAQAIAGIFIPLLVDAGVLGGDVSVRCPANGRQPPSTEPAQVARLEQWYATAPDRYRRTARELAGDYAYTLGYRDGAGLHGLRWGPGNDMTPILCDRPPTEPGRGNSLNHGGLGQNVLYIGGEVRFLPTRQVGADDIYLNLRHRVEAGVHRDDTVLAPSDAAP